MKDIIVITGPTGVGKTKISVEIAKLINGEVINADSMQFYKNLNIGTAKIRSDEMENIPHHLFDIVEIEDMFTIYDYQSIARKKIDEIISRNKKVIIVGGSALYIRALLYNYNLKEGKSNDTFDELSNEELLNRIKISNPNIDIHVNNRKRLIRTLNKVLNNEELNSMSTPIYDFDLIGLNTSREHLYSTINSRVDKMVEEGLIEEVRSIYDKNIRSKSVMTGIGYKELYKFFDGEVSLEEAIDLIKKNSRNYAKRQYTFLKNKFDIKWFDVNYESINSTIDEIFNYIKR